MIGPRACRAGVFSGWATAAQQAGVSKSTILRAIKSGRLSAGKTEAGGYVAPDAVQFAVMETEVKALRAMADELRTSRDQWQAQAERATLALAAPARSWWQRLAG